MELEKIVGELKDKIVSTWGVELDNESLKTLVEKTIEALKDKQPKQVVLKEFNFSVRFGKTYQAVTFTIIPRGYVTSRSTKPKTDTSIRLQLGFGNSIAIESLIDLIQQVEGTETKLLKLLRAINYVVNRIDLEYGV